MVNIELKWAFTELFIQHFVYSVNRFPANDFWFEFLKKKKTQTQVYGLQNLALIWTLFIMGLLSGTVIKSKRSRLLWLIHKKHKAMSLLLMLRISKYYVILVLAAKLWDVCTFVNPRFSKLFPKVNV